MVTKSLASQWLATNVIIASYVVMVFALWLLAQRPTACKERIAVIAQERAGESWPPATTLKKSGVTA